MDSDFCEDVESDYSRRVYTTYINSGVQADDAAKMCIRDRYKGEGSTVIPDHPGEWS